MAVMAAWLGLTAALTAQPVTVPDFSFEQTVFPVATNVLTPGGTAIFNNVPGTDWFGTGAPYLFETNAQSFAEAYPATYIQNADVTNGVASLFPTNADGTLLAPAEGTNYAVLGGSGDMNIWENVGPLQPNTIYTLTVAVGIDLQDGYLPADGTSGYGGGTALLALVNGTNVNDIFAPGAILASMPIENTNPAIYTLGTWVDNVLVFTNGYQASSGLTILLRGTSGFAVDVDNVRLNATPASFTAVAPTVTTDLGSNTTTVNQGTLVTLSENPVGTAPFTYGWQTDTGTHGATWTAIAGANSTNYVVNTASIVPSTPVEFHVVVTNGGIASTSSPVTLTTITNAPILVRDTLPSTGSFDVVGSTVAFNAVFDGSRPITYQWQFNGADLPGATNETLTLDLTNIDQSGDYSLLASNALGTNASTPQTFTVNALPPATNGIIVTDGLEWASFFGAAGYNDVFNPTWPLATNNIIAGLAPSSSFGVFTLAGCGGLSVLTDGSIAGISPPDNTSQCFASCGDGTTTNQQGSSIIFTLPPTAGNVGWTITNLTSFGGWGDDGREEQSYQVSYSSPLSPSNFTLLPWAAFNPPNPPAASYGGGVPTATKMTMISTNGVLAQNVAAVRFNFYSLAGGQTPKNGWEGYAQFQLLGFVSTNFPPAVVQSITPAVGSDVVGSSVTIEAGFASPEPLTYTWLQDGVPIPGKTNSMLTLTNLQLSDTSINPGYVLEASNSLGVSFSQPCAFTVNPSAGADGSGVIISEANQAVPGGLFTPTWPIPTNSLIEGVEPFIAEGNFQQQNSANGGLEGGVPTLTDGTYGVVGEGDTLTGASIGSGQALYYKLPASSNGWNITSIETYGGWNDVGRNWQGYEIDYATVAAPNTFIELDALSPAYDPPVPAAEPNATRVIWTSGTGEPLATNVVAIEFNFDVSVENGWEGYNELQVFGTNAVVAVPPAQTAPVLINDIAPGYASDVVGSSVTFNATFSGATSYQWQFNGTNLSGAITDTLTLTDLNLNMTGSYDLLAINAYGTNSTSAAPFTVNPVPDPVNGIIYSDAVQIDGNYGLGLAPTQFLPTWDIASGSLIAGQLPSTVGPGNFLAQTPAGGIPVLTDGTIGELVSGGAVTNYATCGTVSSGTGQYVIYTLKGSPGGYNINSIVTYGGWPDYGRDWQ